MTLQAARFVALGPPTQQPQVSLVLTKLRSIWFAMLEQKKNGQSPVRVDPIALASGICWPLNKSLNR